MTLQLYLKRETQSQRERKKERERERERERQGKRQSRLGQVVNKFLTNAAVFFLGAAT